jgi:4-carboxymuconolactone decarboxylase
MPRIPPIRGKEDVAPDYHPVVDEVIAIFGNVRGPFSMLLHSPELASRLLKLITFNRNVSIVPAALRSLAILAMVRERQAAYVWSAQVGAARRAGLRDELIDLLRAQGDPAGLAAEEQEIIRYARQLARTNRADQTLFDALKNRHGIQWLVELTAAMNFFGFLSGITNAFEVPAPPDGDRLPV